MTNELLEQLQTWHEQEEHGLIIERIEQIPVAERGYELVNLLARAYNNEERYREAVDQLLSVQEQGAADALWQYRLGYAYYHLALHDQALLAFEQADELQPDDPATLEFLEHVRPYAERMEQQRQRWQREQAAWVQSGKGNELTAASEGYDPDTFWEPSEYADKNHVSPPFDDAMIAELEQELGYKLPASYINLMRTQNGGCSARTAFPTDEATSWSEDHIEITSILGIGKKKSYSIGGDMGSRFMIEEWGYPDLGIMICDCPSAGHDIVMLDYRFCGPEGEPCVVHIDQESDYEITYLAPNFEAFIRGLVDSESFDLDGEDEED